MNYETPYETYLSLSVAEQPAAGNQGSPYFFYKEMHDAFLMINENCVKRTILIFIFLDFLRETKIFGVF